MTHASRTHDIFELLTNIRDQLDKALNVDPELHKTIVLNNAIALMRSVAAKSRCSESDRQALKAVAEQLGRVA